MRTTLALDDDVLQAAKELARAQRRTLGEVISDLARHSLAPAPRRVRRRNGVPLLPRGANPKLVTSELVRRLGEELPYAGVAPLARPPRQNGNLPGRRAR